MRRLTPRMLTLWSLLAALPAEAREVRRFVVVAGANDGGESRETLRWAVADAERVASVLLDLGGVAAPDLDVLREPSADQLQATLARVGDRVRSAEQQGDVRTEVMVYFSGHSDETGLLLGSDHLGYDALRKSLEGIPSDVRVAVVDACASGALVREKGGVQRPAFLLDLSNDVIGQAILTSSSAEESSQESDRLEGSYFTHHLVAGLRGAADLSGDGRVTLTEAYRFAYDATLDSTERSLAGPQHPSYQMRLEGAGDLVITDVTHTESTLSLRSDLEGRIFLRDELGHLVVELTKGLGRDVDLGVDAGTYRLTVDRDSGLYEATVVLERGTTLQVSTDQMVQAMALLEAGRARGAAPEPAEPSPEVVGRGELVVTSPNLFGEVWVAGVRCGWVPAVCRDVPAGLVTVEIRVDGKAYRSMRATVVPDRSDRVTVR